MIMSLTNSEVEKVFECLNYISMGCVYIFQVIFTASPAIVGELYNNESNKTECSFPFFIALELFTYNYNK